MPSNNSRAARDRLLHSLRRELMGPTEPTETFREYPTTRYIVGRLAPARTSEDDTDAQVNDSENDTLALDVAGGEEDDDESQSPLIIAFNPSSFGLSFLVDPSVSSLRINVSWGDYKREQDEKGAALWKRVPREGVVDGVPVAEARQIPRITLSPSDSSNPKSVAVSGVDDREIALEGVVHDFFGYRAVSLFLVNRRTKGKLADRAKDERWIFQPMMSVTTAQGDSAFVARDLRSDLTGADEDGEASVNRMLYRHAREFATGHGVAAGWAEPSAGGKRTTSVFTEFIPSFEVPLLIAPGDGSGRASLDMKTLAEAKSADVVAVLVDPMIRAYESWIEGLEKESTQPDISEDDQHRDSARMNIRRCRECASRMRAGLALVLDDRHVFEAFRFANRAMWNQRIYSIWAAQNRKLGKVTGEASDFDVADNRTWRPFQIGFILMTLGGIAEETSPDRKTVDLLWFPTGGGKTEAYLGLAAFALALRRLRGDRFDMRSEAGVSVIMRYTMRLLTIQQFQRAAGLITACEVERRRDPTQWGTEPFRIGIWVGRGTTPNSFAESLRALEDIRQGKTPRQGSPVQLVSCPRCGEALVNDRGVPHWPTYLADTNAMRTRIFCRNGRCEFNATSSAGEGIPAVLVDSEIYRTCPSLVVATVDKFARMPFKGETQALFGICNRYSPTLGHLTEAHGDSVEGRRVRDAKTRPRLLPPELVIQDELHLISGPLGTMVGLYETAVDYAAGLQISPDVSVPAKVVASTATIRRAANQARQLFARGLEIFPPPGLSARDSFFARELPIDEEKDRTAGRLYVGVNAPGSSTKTLLVRVYSLLLAAAGAELEADASTADPYGTLVGYFGSLKALGGAKRVVEDDVKLMRLKYLSRQRGFPYRSINNPEELTSRLDSWRIPALLQRLDSQFPRGKGEWPVDVLLATNMISVGVDIDRLGLMVVTGQPKATAEYIQATSRIGRRFPGLVVTMYNWLGFRDLSHYERFRTYHAALYRHVEAISVTPFSSRALDRGLRGVFAAMNRLTTSAMAREPDAINFDSVGPRAQSIIDWIVDRAALLVGGADADLVRERLLAYRDEWSRLAERPLRYSWLDESTKPPQNSRVLLRTAGTENEGEWSVPGSLREVEAAAAFYLDETESAS